MISDMIATCESMRINFDAPATEGLFDKFLPKSTVYDSPNKAFEVLMVIAHKNNYEFEKDDAAKKHLTSLLSIYKEYPGKGGTKLTSVLKTINGIPVIVSTLDKDIGKNRPTRVSFAYVMHKNGSTKAIDGAWSAKCASMK